MAAISRAQRISEPRGATSRLLEATAAGGHSNGGAANLIGRPQVERRLLGTPMALARLMGAAQIDIGANLNSIWPGIQLDGRQLSNITLANSSARADWRTNERI